MLDERGETSADGSPFHEGELSIQNRAGVTVDADAAGRRTIRGYMPEQHRAFHTSLAFMVAAARDARGQPWATIIAGPSGFITSPDPRTLSIHASVPSGDALEGALGPGDDIGLLGIEPGTRRRNRLNGRLVHYDSNALTLAVDQTFGNCPQYIHTREWQYVDRPLRQARKRRDVLTRAQRDWIARADTFFIATGYRGDGDSPASGMDASHRGGEPGFVQVADARHLVFPDYAGNHFFNTLGNIHLDSRAGLLFIDFERGSLLQLAVRATINWDSSAIDAFPGARRLVRCEINDVIELPAALPLRWTASGSPVRALRLADKQIESDDVVSFFLAARDGGELPGFQAGQHLPIEWQLPGQPGKIHRFYSLSNAVDTDHYRISVKREPNGVGSRYLHDDLTAGDVIYAGAPSGDFVLQPGDDTVVLISAGIGVTPMLSMLETLANGPDERPVWFIHGARDGRHHPFAEAVRQAADRRTGIQTHIAYSRPGPDDRLGVHYDSAGRVDGALVDRLVGGKPADYYLCGPTRFLADVQNHLESSGVTPDRIHTETFGPAGRAAAAV